MCATVVAAIGARVFARVLAMDTLLGHRLTHNSCGEMGLLVVYVTHPTLCGRDLTWLALKCELVALESVVVKATWDTCHINVTCSVLLGWLATEPLDCSWC